MKSFTHTSSKNLNLACQKWGLNGPALGVWPIFPTPVVSYILWGLILKRVLFITHDQLDRFINDLKVDLNIVKKRLDQEQGSLKIVTEERDEVKCFKEKLKEAP